MLFNGGTFIIVSDAGHAAVVKALFVDIRQLFKGL